MTKSDLIKLQESFSRLSGERDLLSSQLKENESLLQQLQDDLEVHRQAVSLLGACSEVMREGIVNTINKLVQPALRAIYGPGIVLNCSYKEVPSGYRMQLELEADGISANPLEAFGGGVSDVLSLGLRVTSMMLGHRHQPKLLILDESFKHCDEAHVPLIGALLKDFSERLGIQIILVTHQPVFADFADRSFQVKRSVGGESVIV